MTLPKVVSVRGRVWHVHTSARTGLVHLTSLGQTVGAVVKFENGTWQDLRDRKIQPSDAELTAAWQSAFERAVKAARKFQ